jgi:phage portal protein BeeE
LAAAPNFATASRKFIRPLRLSPLSPLLACCTGSAWLQPRWPDVTISADLDAVPALAGEREAMWARLEAASFLTPEERRRMAGLEV